MEREKEEGESIPEIFEEIQERERKIANSKNCEMNKRLKRNFDNKLKNE